LPYLCATGADGGVVAYAYAGPYRPRSAYRFTVEDSVYVAPSAAGRGIGRALLRQVIDICAGLGRRQMVAVIGDSGNEASIGLHARHGFMPAGVMRSIGFKLGLMKPNAKKVRPLGDGKVIAGFAGATADAFTLFERRGLAPGLHRPWSSSTGGGCTACDGPSRSRSP